MSLKDSSQREVEGLQRAPAEEEEISSEGHVGEECGAVVRVI